MALWRVGDTRALWQTPESLPQAPSDTSYPIDLRSHRCAVCPLKPVAGADCPLARALAPLARATAHVCSYENVRLVIQEAKTEVAWDAPLQRALARLANRAFGSGACPVTIDAPSMHDLPGTDLKSIESVLSHALGGALTRQCLNGSDAPDLGEALEELSLLYANRRRILSALIDRMRDASIGDAFINGLVLLDMESKSALGLLQQGWTRTRSELAKAVVGTSADPLGTVGVNAG